MKRWIMAVVMVLVAGSAWAGGWSETYSLGSGGVSITNTQANSSWVPVALMWRFTSAGTGTVEVSRVSLGVSFILGNCGFTNGVHKGHVSPFDNWLRSDRAMLRLLL